MNQSKEQLETLLSDYVDGNLAGEELAKVEAYLDQNPGVRDAVNRIIVDSESLRSLPRVNAPFDFSEDVRGQLERDLLLDGGAIQFPRRKRVSSLLSAVAAMLILFVGLGGAAYWMLANRPAPYLDVAINTPAPAVPSAEKASPMQDGGGARTDAALSPKPSDADNSPPRPAAMIAKEERPSGPSESAAVAKDAQDEATPPGALADHGDDKSRHLMVPAEQGVTTESTSSPAMGRAMESAPVPSTLSLEAAPREIAELVEESPRFSDNAVAVVVDAEHAGTAKSAVHDFALSNAVRTQALAYDSSRNRAVLPPEVDAGMNQNSQVQISGSNVAFPPLTSSQLPVETTQKQPQVMMAIGLTQSQLSGLQKALESGVGDSRLQAYTLAGSPALRRDRGQAEQKIENEIAEPASRPMSILLGDQLRIDLIDPGAKAMLRSDTVTVSELGTIDIPGLEPVHAAGLTPAALRQAVVEAYIAKGEVHDPVVQVERIGAPATQPATGLTPPNSPSPERATHAHDEPERFDVYLVMRNESPATQPAPADAPTSQPVP